MLCHLLESRKMGPRFTHFYLETRKRVIGKQRTPDLTPHHVASDQDLHCLLTGFLIKNRIQVTK